jgi:hypothetical protein
MLKPIKTKTARASGGTFAIVASHYKNRLATIKIIG